MADQEKIIKSLNSKLDISNQKIRGLEKQLEDNYQFRMAIFSNLSHEIRTPLNGIVGFSEILNTNNVSNEELKLYSGVIAESSVMLMALLNDVFDIIKIEANLFKAYPVAFDLNDLIFHLFSYYKLKAEAKGLQLFLENLISEQFIITSDPDVIKRVLTKLLDNSIKFTKQGWIKLSYFKDNDRVVFSIEDTGIGIPEPLRSNLFDRFIKEEVSKSRNIGATGLDLSLCNGLVRLLDGEIWFEPKVQNGSIFSFSILNRGKEWQ